MAFIPTIEISSLEEQQAFQEERLKETLRYVSAHSTFYKRWEGIVNWGYKDLNFFDRWNMLPTTSKDDLQLYNRDFLCVPKTAIREYTATSGTLGKAVSIALTENDLQRLAYNEYLSFHSMCVTEHDNIQLLLTLDKQFMAGMAYYSGARKLGATVIRSGPGGAEAQLRLMQHLESSALVAVPSFIINIIEIAKTIGVELNNLGIKKILSIGEPIRTNQLSPNSLSKHITDNWNVELYGTYASTEMQTAFTECCMHNGGHHHPELIYVELLDENGNAVADSEAGEVTITNIGVEAMPLIRYRTGDICRAYYEPCECGRKTMRLGPVIGRKNHLIKLKGTSIYPAQISEVMHKHLHSQDFIIVANKNQYLLDEIILYVSDKYEKLSKNITSDLQQQLRVTPSIIFTSSEEIIKKQHVNDARKPLRFIDNREG